MRQGSGGGMGAPTGNQNEQAIRMGEYAATVNLSSSSTWQYPLKTLPRPSGKGTRVIITEYDLPRPETLPHDAIVDKDGMVWYGDFGSQYLGVLNPRTLEIKEYPIPLTKPGAATGFLDMNFDPDGNIVVVNVNDDAVLTFSPDGLLVRTEHTVDGGNDGLVILDDGTKYVSSVRFGTVSRIRPGEPAEVVASGIPSAASMAYDSRRNRLLIPMNDWNAFTIVDLDD